jgi:hypothetical protein
MERIYKKFRDRIKDLDKPASPPAPPADDSAKPGKGSL